MAQLYSAYLDESGTHGESNAVVVAGFLSNASEWVAFSEEWKVALDEWQIPMFHMAKFENRQGNFKSWSDQQRRDRLNHLLGIIKKHTFQSIAYVIRVKQYNEIFSNKVKKLWNAYDIASIGCYFNLRQLVKGVDGFIDFTMESGAEGASALAWMYDIQSKYPEWVEDTRMYSLSFRDKRIYLPLQAADILAYEIYKHAQRQFGNETRPPRYPLKQLAIPGRNNWHYASDVELISTNDYLTELASKIEDSNA